MSSSGSHEQLNEARAGQYSKLRRTWLMPTVGLALPFMPAPVAFLVGLALGYHYLNKTKIIKKMNEIRNPGKRYFPKPPKDAEVVKQILLGYAMDFSDFIDSEERYMQEHQIHRPGPDDKKAHLDEIILHMYPLNLSDDLSTRHVAIQGATGVGKTELYLAVMFMNIARGGGGIVFDAKGEKTVISKINYIAKLFHREDDVIFINFNEPDLSHSYNPLIHGGNVRETVSTVMKLNAKSKEEFFRDLNRAGLVAAMVCLQAQPDKPAFHFGDLGVLFTDLYVFHQLFDSIPKEDREAREFVWMFLKSWVKEERDTGLPMYNTEEYRKFYRGLQTKMFDFAHTDYRKVLCTYEPDLELKSAIMENKIVVVSLPALSDKEGVSLFGKLFLADFARAVGQLQAEGTKPVVPYIVLLDEYGAFKDETHQDLFQLARDRNISLWVSVQSRGFLEEESPIFARNLLSNCWTHIYLYCKDDEDQEKAARSAGSAIRHFKTETENESFGYGHSNATMGDIRLENTGKTTSRGYRAMRENLLLPEHFDMDEGDAIIIGKGGVFRVRMPLVEFEEDAPEIERVSRFSKTKRNGMHLMEKTLQRDTAMIDQLSKRVKELRP